MRLPGAFGALTALLAFAACLPVTASAQSSGDFNPLVFGTSVSVALSPQYPKPGETVHLSAQTTGIDLSKSEVEWLADGKVIAHGFGATDVSVVVGGLGSRTQIELDLVPPDKSFRTATATIAPTELDVLVDSDSYTPPFYRGRALPSAGTDLILQALARFKHSDGTPVPDVDIVYTWKRNGETLGNLSGRGRSSAIIPVLHLFTGDIITVRAESSDKTLSGETTVSVPPSDTVLDLYEDHPLYGILYGKALGETTVIPESEMTFAAVPYFAQARNANGFGLSYAWRVGDLAVTPSISTPSEITINADNSTGQARIALVVTSATNFYMDAEGKWNVLFSSAASPADVFRTSAQ